MTLLRYHPSTAGGGVSFQYMESMMRSIHMITDAIVIASQMTNSMLQFQRQHQMPLDEQRDELVDGAAQMYAIL